MNHNGQNHYCVGIIAATHWEVRSLIHELRMKKKDQNRYEVQLSNGSVIFQISGVGQNRAKNAAEKIISFSPSLIISTGFAGALKNEMEAGHIVLDIEKSDPSIANSCVKIADRIKLKIFQGKFLTIDRIIFDQKEKMELARKTDAIAVEMESDAIFKLCREKRIPFCSIRTISDRLNQNLPSIASGMGPEGKINLKFLKTLAVHPADWMNLFHLTLSSKKAEKSLAVFLTQFIEELLKGEIKHAN